MSKANFLATIKAELARLDLAGVGKRQEIIITGFGDEASPQALVGESRLRIFNSNDYLGLRHHPRLKKADHEAVETYGTGPGAVRFISGTLAVHHELERALAHFHRREAALIISSAFATNLAVIPALARSQSKDSKMLGEALIISDELNHRSIIEGIRATSLPANQKAIFKHLDANDLDRLLQENRGQFTRVIVVTDGVFSMLGEYQDLAKLKNVIDKYDQDYQEGILLVVDDAHGVGCFGQTGRGVEEVCHTQADLLVGTLGKAFGTDGGYVVGDQVLIDYLREVAATYVYSNSLAPGTAGAALEAVTLMSGERGREILAQLQRNITLCKRLLHKHGCTLAAESHHPIQPLLVGDPQKTKTIKTKLFQRGFLVSNINYPVVPPGRDEIRIQISAAQTEEDIQLFVTALAGVIEEVG